MAAVEESDRARTLVSRFGAGGGSHCGYCKGSKGRGSYNHSMRTLSLTIDDYQLLVDRGWRRCGTSCYKPTMDKTCCPSYTIRCDVGEYKLSKSQKKVIKKFNKHLCNNKSMDCDDSDEDNEVDIPCASKDKNAAKENPSSSSKTEINDKSINVSTKCNKKETEILKGKGPDPHKLPCKKAKLLRLEKREAKLKSKGIDASSSDQNKTQEKHIDDFLNSLPGDMVKKLEIKLVRSSCSDPEWDNTLETITHNLYTKYQMVVHGDSEKKCSRSRFLNFLVNSSLQIKTVSTKSDEFKRHLKTSIKLFSKYQDIIHDDKPSDEDEFIDFLVKSSLKHETRNGVEYGSFHQQYWLENELIAVGVIDILPKCVSSVYFFYDPIYLKLTIGTYGALREIGFTRSLQKICPDIKYYYMGFYIHSCVKMRYKGNYAPSYLLCPETYDWFPLESCITKLDQNPYCRLNDDIDAVDKDSFVDRMVDDCLLSFSVSQSIITLKDYKRKFGVLRQSLFLKVEEMLILLGELVGRVGAQRIVYHFEI